MQRVLICLVASAFVGCAPTAAPPPAPPQPMEIAIATTGADYAPFSLAGTAGLTGQAFLTTRGGDVKLAAGRTVTLDPATPYARGWFAKYGGDLDRADELPPNVAFQHARRRTVADAQGKFHFENLAPGSYIVRTTVTWETGARYSGLQGGVVAAVVDIPDGKTSEVILNTRVFPVGSVAARPPIITREEVGSRPYTKVKTISGISCNMNGGQSISVDAARDDLVYNAAQLKADAVANVVCKGGGFSLTKNCMQYFSVQATRLPGTERRLRSQLARQSGCGYAAMVGACLRS